MAINYTALLSLAEPVTGTESGTWGDNVNKGLTDYLDIAVAGTNTLSTDANVTLTATQGASAGNNISATTAQYMQLLCNGARTAIRNITVPATSKIYIVNNSTTGGFAVLVKTGVSVGVSIANGEKAVIAFDGSDFVKVASSLFSGLTGIVPVANGGTGASTLTGLVYGNGTSPMTAATGAQISTAIGATAVTNATTATNIAGGTTGQLAYQSAVNATTFAPVPTTGFVLSWSGSAFNWIAGVPSASSANLSGGGANTVVYQSAVGVTAYLPNGTTGQVLTANTGAAPTWTPIPASVTSFQTSLSGLTPATSSTGAITLAGTLGTSSGGTNTTATPTAGTVPYGTGTALAYSAVGTTGQFLTSAGASAPTWTTLTVPVPTGSTLYLNQNFGGF
jgi:hypothetical protein